jgi:hypothetical protein
LAAQLQASFGRIGEIPAGEAYLGKGDGTSTVIADSANRLVYTNDGQTWTQTPLDQKVAITAVEGQAGIRVKLGRPNYDPRRVYVTGFTPSAVVQAFGGVLPGEQQTMASFYPDAGRIKDFRIAPQSPASLSVHVNGGAYYDITGEWSHFGGDDIDDDVVTAVGALSSGQHQMGVVVFDQSTGVLSLLTNTAASGGVSDKDIWDVTEVITILTGQTGVLPCGTFHMYYGQTAITEDDIYRQADPRVPFSRPPNMTTGSYPPPIDLVNSIYAVATNTQVVVEKFEISGSGSITLTGTGRVVFV